MLRPRRHVRYNTFVNALYKIYKMHIVSWTVGF